MTGFTYAIGDIHGRLDLLRLAIRAILADGKGEHHRIVTLGDYVDRGPDSRGVVDFLMANGERLRIVSLKGNHEAMMVDAPGRCRSGCFRVAKRPCAPMAGPGGADRRRRSCRPIISIGWTHGR